MYVYPKKITSFKTGGQEIVEDGSQRRIKTMPVINYRNDPINMGLVKTFFAAIEKINNLGDDVGELYVIRFCFLKDADCIWHFENKEDRDEEFKQLLEQTGAAKFYGEEKC